MFVLFWFLYKLNLACVSYYFFVLKKLFFLSILVVITGPWTNRLGKLLVLLMIFRKKYKSWTRQVFLFIKFNQYSSISLYLIFSFFFCLFFKVILVLNMYYFSYLQFIFLKAELFLQVYCCLLHFITCFCLHYKFTLWLPWFVYCFYLNFKSVSVVFHANYLWCFVYCCSQLIYNLCKTFACLKDVFENFFLKYFLATYVCLYKGFLSNS